MKNRLTKEVLIGVSLMYFTVGKVSKQPLLTLRFNCRTGYRLSNINNHYNVICQFKLCTYDLNPSALITIILI